MYTYSPVCAPPVFSDEERSYDVNILEFAFRLIKTSTWPTKERRNFTQVWRGGVPFLLLLTMNLYE